MGGTFTAVGNLTYDPELRFTPGGKAWCTLSIAESSRVYDKESNEWRDGNTNFWRCKAFGPMAEMIAESLTKGTRVIAIGTFRSDEYTDKDGNKRKSLDLVLEEIAPALRFATAKSQAMTRTSAPGSAGAPASDPWASTPNDPPF